MQEATIRNSKSIVQQKREREKKERALHKCDFLEIKGEKIVKEIQSQRCIRQMPLLRIFI